MLRDGSGVVHRTSSKGLSDPRDPIRFRLGFEANLGFYVPQKWLDILKYYRKLQLLLYTTLYSDLNPQDLLVRLKYQ